MLIQTKLRQPITNRDHIQGPEEASIKLVEYGDYECPFCGEAYVIVKKVQQVLGDELRYVFRNFPLTQAHPYALDAAKAAEAAGLQGAFWEMHDLLYENQDDLDPESLLSYAANLNLDLDGFIDDMSSEEVEERVLGEMYEGARTGVHGTPTFFVNGYRYEGDWRSVEFLQMLNAMKRRSGSRKENELGGINF